MIKIGSVCVLKYDTWQIIRSQFLVSERAKIIEAEVGQTLCPRSVSIDTNKLPMGLSIKLGNAIDEAERVK